MEPDVEREFRVNLAKLVLTDINAIYCINAQLGMDRSAIEK